MKCSIPKATTNILHITGFEKNSLSLVEGNYQEKILKNTEQTK